MMRSSLAAPSTLLRACLSIALLVPRVVPAQGLDAINRARAAAATASQRNQQVDQQAQQATQQGTQKPASPAGSAPAGAPPQGGAAASAGNAPADAPAARRPLPKIQSSAAGPASAASIPVDLPNSHTVAKGETLWGISQRYLGDPYLWPELYRLNTEVVEDPRWIYPGEVLRLPGATAAAMPAAATVGALSVKAPPGAPVSVVDVRTEEPPGGATVFTEVRTVSGTAARAATIARTTPILKAGEFTSAPFVTAFGGPAWSGKITDALASSGVEYDRSDRAMQFAELVSINPPSGGPATIGQKYLVIRHGESVKGLGEVVVPTGVVEVEVLDKGRAPVARVKQIFEAIRPGQGLIPLERVRLDSLARPVPVLNGPMTSVMYVVGDPVLPSLQSYLVLGTKGLGTVRPGDVFTIVQGASKTSAGVTMPEEILATVQVVRVTPQAATAVITGTRKGGISAGMPARLSARMPTS